jgi:hypothetical protein
MAGSIWWNKAAHLMEAGKHREEGWGQGEKCTLQRHNPVFFFLQQGLLFIIIIHLFICAYIV